MKPFDWNDLLKLLFAGGGLSVIVLALINWRRHRKEDKAKARKTEAEADEIEERRALIKLQRDERVFEISTKLVEKLSEECETTKNELDSTLHELQRVREALSNANRRCAELEQTLQRERENNKICFAEVEQLKIELEKLKRESNRRPT